MRRGTATRAPARAITARAATALVAAAALLAGCTVAVGGSAQPRPELMTSDSVTTTTTSTTTSTSTSTAVSTTDPGTPNSDTTTTIHSTTTQMFPTVTTTQGVPDSDVGPKSDVPTASLEVKGDTGSESDVIAIDALADLFDYYDSIFEKDFHQPFVPPEKLVSYDSRKKHGRVCGESTYQLVNAFFAPSCDLVAWDRGVLLPQLISEVGELAPAVVLSHEMGHDVQHQVGVPEGTSGLVMEQQADCYAGAYWRWVADGHSSYFNFNQSEGMRQLLLTLFQGHDPAGTSGSDSQAHGNGFDRTYAVTLGYTSGAVRCSQIDNAAIEQRGSQFPFDNGLPQNYGNVEITSTVLEDLIGTVNDYFTQTAPGYDPPTLETFDGQDPPACDGYTSSYPVTYCPTTNTVSYNLAELQRIGTPTAGWESANGDFSAIVLLVSRYALAAQAAGHSSITGNNAGMRALCYAGTWATWMRDPHDGYTLSPNDLDKAIYEIVSSPLTGADVNGQTTATLIERVQAFAIGVTHPITECFDFYSD